jgi:23S rRNA (guanosine2251-2'-O)-methyltransferase
LKEKSELRRGDEEPGPEAGLLRIYGRRPVLMALRAHRVRRLWIAPRAHGETIQEIGRLASEQALAVQRLNGSQFSKESGEVHQGVVATATMPSPRHDLEAFVAEALNRNEWALFLILDGVEDPQNFGAIFRTAECAGVNGVIVAARRRAPLSSVTVKASAGAVFSVPFVEVGNLHQAVRFLKEKGIWVVAAAGEGEANYGDFDWRRPVALIMGAEGRGVSHLLKQAADVQVSIPLSGTVESLNVSVATGVLLFECTRQRRWAGGHGTGG